MELDFELINGYKYQDKPYKSVTLMKLNGTGEKIITTRLPEKPYTYISYILAASIKEIEDLSIASKARAQYIEDDKIAVPLALLHMPMAEAATCLLEIHRKLWKSTVKDQKCYCSNCGGTFITDVDLNRVDLPEKEAEKIVPFRETIEVKLPEGWEYVAPKLPNNQESEYAAYDGIVFTHMEFRVPTLGNAIQFEKIASRDVEFWRQIARHTLFRVYNDKVELPQPAFTGLGIKLFDSILYSEDLIAIRSALRDSIPSKGFWYNETCPHCHRETPITLEGNGFFPS